MEVEIFTLCDAATEWMGKLNILGTFDRITAPRFPTVHAHCAVALRVRFERIEEGNHKVRINFVNADGKSVIPALNGEVGVRFGDDLQSVCPNLILNLDRLKFEGPGQYSIDLAIDGRQEKSLPVHVVLAEPSAPPAEPGK